MTKKANKKNPASNGATDSNAPVETYDASKISVLEGLEAVRKRPGMYIGSTDVRGLHHLVFEVVDNAIDEALAGSCDRIEISIAQDHVVTVVDNGRGIPVDIHKQTGKSALEVVMTKLHAGAKFGQGGYKVASGLHGVGVSAVNALSEWLETTVRRDGQLYRQKYARGVPKADVKVVGKYPKDERTGTTQRFYPDKQIFKEIDYKFDVLAQRFREMAFLTRGLTISFRDERDGRAMTFYFEGGITSFVRYLNKNRKVLHAPFAVSRPVNGSQIEAAIQYTDGYGDSVYTFANNINTVDGGTHLTGFRAALTRTLNDFARKSNMLKENDSNLTGDDVREGLTAILSVKIEEPQFESQTKAKLGNAEIKTQVESVIAESFSAFLEENSREGKAIIEKCITSARAREAARQARDLVIRKSALESLSLPGKLADCSERNPENAELYIVEGDSAGGCLGGETRVKLASGNSKMMRDLAEDWQQNIQHFGYATNQDGDIRIVPLVEPRMTKRDAALVAVILDNGEQIRCTPDHPFRLRDGSYKKASELVPGESLMPLKTRLTTAEELPGPGYEMAWMNGRNAWWQSHPEHREKIVAARQRGWSDPELRHRVLSALEKWREGTGAEEKGRIIRNGHRLKSLQLLTQVLDAPEVKQSYESLRLRAAPTALRYDRLLEEYFAGDESRMLEAAALVNCKVIAVRPLDETADVYDVTVEGYENFALASGVFVHNSAKQGRDRRFQAILPLRGKILNVEKTRLDKMLQNEEIRSMITAIGTGVGEGFDLKNLRYHRVIIMTDADVDGAHIRTLLLTFFFRYMEGLVEHAHLYIAQPPLYKVKIGKQESYVYDDKELDSLKKKNKGDQLDLQRYKGLGEMNPQQLWETTMNPEFRTLLRVSMEDAAEADRTFEMLMGSEVAPRKRFIQTHAKSVKNLDI